MMEMPTITKEVRNWIQWFVKQSLEPGLKSWDVQISKTPNELDKRLMQGGQAALNHTILVLNNILKNNPVIEPMPSKKNG